MFNAADRLKRVLSFWTGVESVRIDGRLHELRRPRPTDDARRMAGDWRAVGNDIRKAMVHEERAASHGA